MNAVFEVLRPGMAATIQDLGRPGYQRWGMVAGGAMDLFAIQAGNLLVGNCRSAAALEFALHGPELRALEDTHICLTGADMSATLDGVPVPKWKNLFIRKSQVLACGKAQHGAWAYLCVTGGFAVPLVLNSASTYARARLGGLSGRALVSGDILKIHPSTASRSRLEGRSLSPGEIPAFGPETVIQVLRGPQDEAFSATIFAIFFREPYRVTMQSDRMGYRLAGPALKPSGPEELITDSVAHGSIQVLPNGQPIVLLADRQTTGGYPKIATVITAELGRMAQIPPGGTVRFKEVSVEQAQDLALEFEASLLRLEAGCSR